MEEELEDKTIKKTEEIINRMLDDGITNTNLDFIYKLSKIKHMAKEDKNMYGEYGRGRGPGYDTYGEYREGRYSKRGYDTKYRGYGHLDRMYDDYDRYMAGRERYGAGEETDKAYKFMIKSLEEYIKFLNEEAENEQQRNMLRDTLQRSMM